MSEHEAINYKYGRKIQQRIQYLIQDIEGHDELEKYPKLISLVKTYFETIGSTFNIEPNNQKVIETNNNALTKINEIFFDKYKLDIWHTYENGSLRKIEVK